MEADLSFFSQDARPGWASTMNSPYSGAQKLLKQWREELAAEEELTLDKQAKKFFAKFKRNLQEVPPEEARGPRIL